MAQRQSNSTGNPTNPNPSDKKANVQPEAMPDQAATAEQLDTGHLYPNGAERMAYMIVDQNEMETRVISDMIEDGTAKRMNFVEPKLANRPAFLRGKDST